MMTKQASLKLVQLLPTSDDIQYVSFYQKTCYGIQLTFEFGSQPDEKRISLHGSIYLGVDQG